MGGDRRRADIEGDSQRPLMKAGHHGDDVAALAQRHGDLPLAGAQRLLQAAQDAEIGARLAKTPLPGERRLQAAQVAGGIVHVGLAHLDIIEAHDGIDDDRMGFGALAHDLAMDLRIRRERR